jgi:hypothetical protein
LIARCHSSAEAGLAARSATISRASRKKRSARSGRISEPAKNRPHCLNWMLVWTVGEGE